MYIGSFSGYCAGNEPMYDACIQISFLKCVCNWGRRGGWGNAILAAKL